MVALVRAYVTDRGGDLAVIVAWNALFSVLPLVLAVLSIVGVLVRDETIRQYLAAAIRSAFPKAADDLLRVLDSTQQHVSGLGVVGSIGLLLSGSALFGSIARALNQIYHVPDRGLLARTAISAAMVVVYAVLLLMLVIGSSAAGVLLAASMALLPFQVPGAGLLYSLAGWGVSLTSAFVLFLVIYWLVPNAGLRVGEVWPGALVAASLTLVATQLFPIYLSISGGLDQYGQAFGAFLVLVIWFYLLSQVPSSTWYSADGAGIHWLLQRRHRVGVAGHGDTGSPMAGQDGRLSAGRFEQGGTW